MVLLWLLFVLGGASIRPLFPAGVVYVAALSAVLLVIGLVFALRDPILDQVGREALLDPLGIVVNFAVKFVLGMAFFLTGYGCARWRERKAGA